MNRRIAINHQSRSNRPDLQQVLVNASKSMIRVKDPITLLKMITRFIDRQIGAEHVAVLLFDKVKQSYVLIDSKGGAGQKIPIGYIRVKKESPIISYFMNYNANEANGRFVRKDALVYQELEHLRKFEILVNRKENSAIQMTEIKKQMDLFKACVCVPSYFKKDLVAVLLLGEKLSRDEYDHEEINVFASLANDVAMAVTNAELIKDLQEAYEKEHELLIDTASALVSAIDARDKYTKGHSERVSHYTLVIVAEMIEEGLIEYDRRFLEAAQLAGLLHDVGKIGIDDAILNKPSSLTDEEFVIMKSHADIGINILKPIKGLKEIADGAKYHHEKYDGSGYPYKLKGEEIPLLGRIIAVADAYDTMVTNRPYKAGRKPDEAFAELERCSGTHFDPDAVAMFLKAYRNGNIKRRNYTNYKFTIRK